MKTLIREAYHLTTRASWLYWDRTPSLPNWVLGQACAAIGSIIYRIWVTLQFAGYAASGDVSWRDLRMTFMSHSFPPRWQQLVAITCALPVMAWRALNRRK